MRGSDCPTDHMLLCNKASFQMASRHQRQPSNGIKIKLDVEKLSNSFAVEILKEALLKSLEETPSNNNPEEIGRVLMDIVYSTASDFLGSPHLEKTSGRI